MDPTKTSEKEQENEKERRDKLNLMRFALLRWWKKKRTFYIHVHPSGYRNSPQAEGAKHRVDGTTDDDSSVHCIVTKSNGRSGECSSSSSSSSYMDVTSISTGRDKLKDTITHTTDILNPNDDCTTSHHHRSNKNRREFPPMNIPTEDEVFLSRPFPFTPRQSVLSQSLQSLDSLTGGDLSDSNEESFVPMHTKSSDSLSNFELSLNSTNITSAEKVQDQDQFFEEHVKFLRNQTQPQRVQELNLIQSKTNKDPSSFHASRFY
jgi:hypothetical protein